MFFPCYQIGIYVYFIQVISVVFFFNILLLHTHFALCIQNICNWTTVITWLVSEWSAILAYDIRTEIM